MINQLTKNVLLACLVVMTVACSEKKHSAKSTQVGYNETHRPQFHFSPPKNWMNDPNGMVFLNGEYHLFYQHYPEDKVWGPMHWGHAVSKDLIHWANLPIALYPDSIGLIFSGSAVYDKQNTSGLGTTDKPPLVAIFTYHSMEKEKAGRSDYQTQGIAYSVDDGRTWKKYANNPVVKNPGERNFRDPKVFWHEGTRQWIMILAAGDHTELWGAPDLKLWKKLSDFGQTLGAHGGVWECPDLFQMKTEDAGEEKWVMLVSINPGAPNGGSGTQYFVGSFDGEKFTCENPTMHWIDYGADDYAGVTWSNIPSTDGRRLFLGWMSNWTYATVVPTTPWRSAMTVARSLKLARINDQFLLKSSPVAELSSILSRYKVLDEETISDSLDISDDLTSQSTYQLDLEFDDVNIDGGFQLELSNEDNQKVTIGFSSVEGNRFFIDRTRSSPDNFSFPFLGKHYAPRFIKDEKLAVRILVDCSSIEMFADDGLTTMTDLVFPNHVFKKIVIKKIKSPLKFRGGKINEINSIW
jgi:fructan beta-fructosidase